ncbi:MAG: PilZ domain-containing protein [Candidatus Omnitrophica bacterium]|nr:PilZ domain-containing protein [Candidatus Omnitrophota bacterium]
MNDKRQYPRVEKSLSLKLSDIEFDIVTETKNISGSGVYCAVNKPLEPMTKLNIIILIPLKKNGGRAKTVKKIQCQGVVVRQESMHDNGKNSYHVGIYFSDIKEHDRKNLVAYINSHIKAPELISPSTNA